MDKPQIIAQSAPNAFPLVCNQYASPIWVDETDAEVVKIAADALIGDIKNISGQTIERFADATVKAKQIVIIGTLGQSALIDQLAKENKIAAEKIEGKWENFLIQTVENPTDQIERALVIAGSDKRGTAFGVFELSRMMGVSPWTWWADVQPVKREALFVTEGVLFSGTPSVQYRGIFLNDEDWGLQPWAAKNMDPDVQDLGPNAYAKICELLLRLKANLLWPAMHPSTKAFYFYKGNPEVADRYSIVIGSSHCEPMLRNNVFEWAENFENEYGKAPGPWRYDTNEGEIQTYWRDRVKETVKHETFYSVGMRGIHDGGMEGELPKQAQVDLLSKVIKDQRRMLEEETDKSAETIGQTFCVYKEVLELYRNGLDLPEDITMIWDDDNHGYIRQLPNEAERKRSGGHGLYYHISYWGKPHDYLWLVSTPPQLMAYELNKAYDSGVNKLWVFNVGDIKPGEFEIEFAMDMAWNIETGAQDKVAGYADAWAERTFGAEFAGAIADIKRQFFQLNMDSRPEHLGLVNFTIEEADKRLANWRKISDLAEALEGCIPESLKDAYYQLIQYPVMAAARMNEKVLYARRSLRLEEQGKDEEAAIYADMSIKAYKEIHSLTEKYNKEMADGKWDGMMDWHPRDLEVFFMPKLAGDMRIDEPEREHLHVCNESVNSCLHSPELLEPEYSADICASEHTALIAGSEMNLVEFEIPGANGKCMTSLPVTASGVALENIEQAPCVEYQLLLQQGEQSLEVRLLPTHPVTGDMDVRYAISINGDEPQVKSIKTVAKSPQWGKNIVRHSARGKTVHHIETSGQTSVKIWLLDPGMALRSIHHK